MTFQFPHIILETRYTIIVSESAMTKEEEIIIIKAREKFMRDGFHKTTMDEIATDLRMSKKTIYKYFPSKEKLVHAAIAHLQNFILEQVTGIIESKDNAIVKTFKIFEFVGSLLQKLNEQVIEDFRVRIPELWEQIDKFRTKMLNENFVEVIKQGKNEGLILDYPTEIIMAIYTSGVRAVINPEFIMNNRFSLDEAKNITIDIMMNGILTDKGKKIYNKSIIRK